MKQKIEIKIEKPSAFPFRCFIDSLNLVISIHLPLILLISSKIQP
jgi:hypothetical protein